MERALRRPRFLPTALLGTALLAAAHPAWAQSVTEPQAETPTVAEDLFDFDLPERSEAEPIWTRGWFWAATSAVVVSGVVAGLLAARGGERCFCLTPDGQPCRSCSP